MSKKDFEYMRTYYPSQGYKLTYLKVKTGLFSSITVPIYHGDDDYVLAEPVKINGETITECDCYVPFDEVPAGDTERKEAFAKDLLDQAGYSTFWANTAEIVDKP